VRLSRLMTACAVAYLLVGAAFALWPYETLRLFGVDPMSWQLGLDPDPARRMPVWTLFGFARLFGAALLGAGTVALLLRRTAAPDSQRDVVTGFLVFNLLVGAMTGLQTLAVFSYWGGAGWWLAAAFAALAAALALGFGRLLFGPRGVMPAGLPAGATLGEVRETWQREVREAAAQQERSRLARDLHDSIKQQLFTINVSAAAVEARLATDAPGARAALAEVRQSVHEAMVEMEAMLQNLQPAALATVGLVEALRQQCEATRFRTGASVTFEAGELPAEGTLPPGAQAGLFRIAQEALSNVARHARARHVEVRLTAGARPEAAARTEDGKNAAGRSRALWRRENQVLEAAAELAITDDGSGFEPGTVRAGRGLSNLSARARELGAELRVETAEGLGTRVVVRVPAVPARSSDASARLQRGLLLGLAAVFGLGLPGRPVLGGAVFWSLLPLALTAAWLSAVAFRAARREQTEAARRLGAGALPVLRLRCERAQARLLLVTALCAWMPPFVGRDALARVNPLVLPGEWATFMMALSAAATLPVLVATLLPLHRSLAALRAQTDAGALRGEIARAFAHAALPVALLLGSVGVCGRFLHDPLIVPLPIGLALWLAVLGYWSWRSRPAEAPVPGSLPR
jgi:signal transduction histidine kinase